MKIEWKTCFKVGICAFLFFICIYYWSGVSSFLSALLSSVIPFLVGGFLAYLLNILLKFYEKYFFRNSKNKIIITIRRPICIIASLLTLLAIVALVIVIVIPELVSAVGLLISVLPSSINSLIEWLAESEFLSNDIISLLKSIDWQTRINQVFDLMTSGIGNVMDFIINTVTSVFSIVINTFLSIIFALYLLFGKDKLKAQSNKLIKTYLSKDVQTRVYYVLDVLNGSFHSYIVGQCTEALIIGVLCTLGMLILGLPYATMIGALVAFTALIPVAGAYIGAIIGAFMIFTVSPLESLIFLIFLIILQQLEGNLIYPRVVGQSVGLPAIWVLLAVTIGGGILGILGMLLGVPLAAAIYRFIKDDVHRREQKINKE